jgi:pilus assembly protein CpaB
MTRATTLSLRGGSGRGLLLALLLAVVAGVLVFAAVNSSDGGSGERVTPQPTAVAQRVTVLRAARDIPARTLITADMLETHELDAAAVLPGALTSQQLAVGMVARIPIYRGEQVVPEKLIDQAGAAAESLSYIVPPGRRAMAVRVDRVVQAGGLIRPGDRVDIIAVLDMVYRQVGGGVEFDQKAVITLAQNIEVLAVEQELQNRVVGDDGQAGVPLDQPDSDPGATVVTLALTPQEAQNLLLAEETGAIRLAVRPPGDNTVETLPQVSTIGLLDPRFEQLLRQALANLGAVGR